MFTYFKKRPELHLSFSSNLSKGRHHRSVSVHKKCTNCELHSLVSDSSRPFSFRSGENVFIVKLIFEFHSVACDTKNVIDYVIFSLIPPPVNNSRNKDVICRCRFSLEPSKAPNTTTMLSNQ